MKLTALLLLFLCLVCPAFAQNGAGPSDTTQTHDYSKHAGRSTNRKLSTGWMVPKGNRTQQTHDYYRTNSTTGKTTHVHGYYHAPKH